MILVDFSGISIAPIAIGHVGTDENLFECIVKSLKTNMAK